MLSAGCDTDKRSAIVILGLLLLAACSEFEARPSPIDSFVAGDYHYYRWSNKPLVNSSNSNDLIYTLDPILRKQLNQELQLKGYTLDHDRAEFTVDYLYAEVWRVVITRIIEDVNSPDRSYMRHDAKKAMQLGTEDLPASS